MPRLRLVAVVFLAATSFVSSLPLKAHGTSLYAACLEFNVETAARLPATHQSAFPRASLWTKQLLDWAKDNKDALQSIGALLGPLVLACGFGFTLSQLRDARHESALGLYMAMFEKFYDLEHIDAAVRTNFEYRFFEKIAPLMEKWLVYPELITDAEMTQFVGIDALLNFFEIVAFASTDRRLLKSATFRDVMFSYWFDLMRDDRHAILRRYFYLSFDAIRKRVEFAAGPTGVRGHLHRWFEDAGWFVGVTRNPPQGRVFLAAYGTLMTGQPNPLKPETRVKMISRGFCYLQGKIFDIPDKDGSHYPALVLAPGDQSSLVMAEMFEIGKDDQHAAGVLREIDRHEEFDPGHPDDPSKSMYCRRYLAVYIDRDQTTKNYAWVYVYNRETAGVLEIKNGNWADYIASGKHESQSAA